MHHAGGSYPVHVSRGALDQVGDLVRALLPECRPIIVADETVAQLYGERLAASLGATASSPNTAPALLTFPAGEASKTRETWGRLTDQIARLGGGRHSAIVALGGGVTGDLAGFVAATWHRGISIVHVPTTLIAMVDSAIGGKTGIDTPAGKNLVGAFHHPAAVVADPDLLATLSDRDFCGGIAEAVKHGLMLDESCFEWLENEAGSLAKRGGQAVSELVRRSVELKAAIVSEDERETGRRVLLNAGHTIAHAVEHASRWETPHGEAVAVGLAVEARLAVLLGILPDPAAARLTALLRRFELPVSFAELKPRVAADAVLDSALADKKSRAAGELRFALPAAIGRAARSADGWTFTASTDQVRSALGAAQES